MPLPRSLASIVSALYADWAASAELTRSDPDARRAIFDPDARFPKRTQAPAWATPDTDANRKARDWIRTFWRFTAQPSTRGQVGAPTFVSDGAWSSLEDALTWWMRATPQQQAMLINSYATREGMTEAQINGLFATARMEQFYVRAAGLVGQVRANSEAYTAEDATEDTAVDRYNARIDGVRHAFPAERVLRWLERRTGRLVCRVCGVVGGESDPQANCECWRCEHCERWHTGDSAPCPSCSRCSDCCECEHCERCGAVEGSCSCGSELGSFHPPLTLHGDAGHAAFPRHVGVEIEFGYNSRRTTQIKKLNEIVNKWRCNLQNDGSIELSPSKELATAPARGQAFIDQIVEVCDGLEEIQAKVDKSCGLHVHVFAGDLTGVKLFSLIRLYTRVENAMYSIVAPSRRGGHYSAAWAPEIEGAMVLEGKRPLKEREDLLDCLLYGNKEQAQHVKRNKVKHNCRYHGLNLNSLILYGTVEFRMHQGTTNKTKITNWARTCCALVEYAATHSEAEIKSLRGDSFEVLCKVVGDRKLTRWLKQRRDHFQLRRMAAAGLVETLDQDELTDDAEASESVDGFAG